MEIKAFISRCQKQRYWGKIERKYHCKLKEDVKSTDLHHNDYMITPFCHLRFVRRFLKRQNIKESDAIIDIGCGLGGMLIFFKKYPFGLVSGLECSREIAEGAKENMQHIQPKPEIIVGDAITYNDYDRFNYFYLFNPFDDEILQDFIKNIEISFVRKPRRLTVIYVNVHNELAFLKDGFTIIAKYGGNAFHHSKSIIMVKDIEYCTGGR